MTQAIVPTSAIEVVQPQGDAFTLAATHLMDKLSETSQRVYQYTFREWIRFAGENGFAPAAITFITLRAFINETDIATSTRQNRLSHMRQVLAALSILDRDTYQRHYEAVNFFLKAKKNPESVERHKRALKPHEATRLLDVWRNQTGFKAIRNEAMIRLLVVTGLRRSELVALKWTDIDLEAGTVHVRHGKGDKERISAILDNTDGTQAALSRLRATQPEGYQHVFPAPSGGRGEYWVADIPCNAETVYQTVKKTAKAAGLGDLAPHDLRRTMITDGLNNGARLHDLQVQAGHSNPSTTLRYAQGADAAELKSRITLSFA